MAPDEDPVDHFLASLNRLEVEWARTTTAGFSDTLDAVIEPPAVGAPLPFDEVSLAGSGVTLNPTPAQLEAAETGVTAIRLGVASYGTIVIESAPDATEAASLFPPLHVAVLRAADIVPDLEAAFQWLGHTLRDEPTSAILATGPSATADMGALVRGAHGPKRVHVIILDDQ